MLEAAQELGRRAEAPASAGAVMASIGCLSAALETLASSAGSVRDVVISSESIQGTEQRKLVAQRLENTRASLRRAAMACKPETSSDVGPRDRGGFLQG